MNTAPSRPRALLIFGAATILLGSSLVHLAASTPPGSSGQQSGDLRSGRAAVGPPPAMIAGRSSCREFAPLMEPYLASDADREASADDQPAAPRVQPEPLTPAAVPAANLALRDPQAPGSEITPPRPSPTEPSAGASHRQPSALIRPRIGGGMFGVGGPPAIPPTPTPAATSAVTVSAPSPAEPRRLLVRDSGGKAVVAREYGMLKDQTAVVLPDGTIGWPTTEVATDEPFAPSTLDELERTLHAADAEYATFRVIKTEHYLVFYQSSERFARDSADLLEKLFERLTGALRKQKLPVTPAEFPLIAVIFRSEADFRANRDVPRDVQAYYEILSNRIFFFENGNRDNAAPEVSAFRRPQTVAHEGTHQLLHNVGIQPRMSPWPIWLVEGLAEYCSPPRSTKKGGLTWDGLGQVNPIHLTTIRDLDDPMSQAVRGGPRPPSARDRGQPLVEYLVTRTELTPTDYALSWGLTHYLAVKRVDQLIAYIRKLNQLRPFELRTPEQQLADFREVFGKNLAKLDTQVADHLDKLKVPEAQALPYYAVMVEQPMPRNAVRRMAMVSQSPSVIRQWFDSISNSSPTEIGWNVTPFPNRTRAVLAADSWIQQGH